MTPTHGQKLAHSQLEQIEKESEGLFEIVAFHGLTNTSYLNIECSVFCGSFERHKNGLPLQSRERFNLYIPQDFPFQVPILKSIHTRFSGFSHVQWMRHLCLYQSESVEWNPSDGMFGYVKRMEEWLQQGALNQLDPVGAPLHPPVAYVSYDTENLFTIVIRENTPTFSDKFWMGNAHLKMESGNRADITGWSPLLKEGAPKPLATALLLSEPMPFEFPDTLSDLIEKLKQRGVSSRDLFTNLQITMILNGEDAPLFFVLGTPMRGIRGSTALKQHLTVWQVDPTTKKALWISMRAILLAHEKEGENREKLIQLANDAEQTVLGWSKTTKVSWCRVMEDRPEIITRRDENSSLKFFRDKNICIWGCGALGSHTATMMARAGAKTISLYDNSLVNPGIIVRQLFDDQDIGKHKATVLAEKLKAINPYLEVEPYTENILSGILASEDWTGGADIIIDTTASNILHQKLELVRKEQPKNIPVISMIIGHEANKGLVVLSPSDYSGGPADIFRKARIASYNQANLNHFRDEFWPDPPRTDLFQPEPGCSSPTFAGASSDVASLCGLMLNSIVSKLEDQESTQLAFASFVAQPHTVFSSDKAYVDLSWSSDIICQDKSAGYEIRITHSSWKETSSWINRSNRYHNPSFETGGLLFGEINDILGIIWVDEVLGPPPDSEASPQGFICGISGTREANDELMDRTKRTVQYIGTWHTHPESAPLPSPTDIAGINHIFEQTGLGSAKTLLMIIGVHEGHKTIGTYFFKGTDFQNPFLEKEIQLIGVSNSGNSYSRPKIGLTLSGGGSRAIAFHLGCLRALHDKGILENIEAISTVSGGSVLGALYVYGNESFEEFEKKVVGLLKKGLFWNIVKQTFLSYRFPQIVGTVLTSGLIEKVSTLFGGIVSSGLKLLHITHIPNIPKLPYRRRVSRTVAFEDVLKKRLFGDMTLADSRKNGTNIIINACELRTGSAFRFGNKETGSWRYGSLENNNVPLSLAVAASAAYPVFLPAIDKDFVFLDKQGRPSSKRVILTDGGVFDNLGVTPFEPGRSKDYGFNTYSPDYIIACDAGPGLSSGEEIPFWWSSRMKLSFETIFRKVQNGGYSRLHNFVKTGQLKGFILPYLGQQDQKLPHIPPDLIKREEVINYPTDFSAMSEEDINAISLRGEQLTRILLSRYCPEL
jgi:integrative and conjugative element protein (TIGR02256 family)